MDQQEDTGPDWQQQQEAERERYEMTVEALNRCAQAGAKPADLKLLAGECGLINYTPPKEASNAAH